jgi:hypothetical protein
MQQPLQDPPCRRSGDALINYHVMERAEMLEGLRETSRGNGCPGLIHAEMGENMSGAMLPSQLREMPMVNGSVRDLSHHC